MDALWNARRWLVDGHVHLHPCFAPAEFLDAAARNFGRAARALGLTDPAPGVLCFTESAGVHAFRALRDGRMTAGAWVLKETGDPAAVLAERDGSRLLLLAGRQVVARGGLEVLALGADADWPDGAGLGETVTAVRRAGAVAVLPWGFGKWWLERGRRVGDVVRAAPPGVFLGDNGGRPRLGVRPPLFDRAARRGMLVLPGSDPLPFRRQQERVGCYGFLLEAPLPASRPAEGFRSALTGLTRQPSSFGRLETPWGFVRSQLAMQWLKRRPKRSGR